MTVADWTPKDVFISYKQSERAKVVRIAEALRGLGLAAWFDAALEPGASFDEEIAREVSSARAVLVCWSRGSVASRWVRSEATIGANRNVLVPVFLERCDLLPPFNLDHTEDLSDWGGESDHEGWRRILRRLGVLTGREGALVDWVAASRADAIRHYRDFLKSFPGDILTKTAKERIWTLELDATRRRLAAELGVSLSAHEPSAEEVQALRSRLESAEMRAEVAEEAARRLETMVRESRQQVEILSAERKLADDRGKDTEAAAAAAATRARKVEARALEADRATAVAKRKATQAGTQAKHPERADGLRQQDDIVRRPCPSCGNMINVAATLCGYCWEKLT